jgi:succinyl-diaminopimelate desuccinylase
LPKKAAVRFDATFVSNAAPFITEPGPFTALLSDAILSQTGTTPSLSTTGGTSDARFICKICPVAEFGLVGRTMHKIDEHVATDDIETLASIYHDILVRALSLQEGS